MLRLVLSFECHWLILQLAKVKVQSERGYFYIFYVSFQFHAHAGHIIQLAPISRMVQCLLGKQGLDGEATSPALLLEWPLQRHNVYAQTFP